MKKSVTVQIYTGNFDSPPNNLDIAAIKRKLSKLYQRANIEYVMLGWNPQADIDEIVDYVKQRETEVYLWLPVFSGWDGLSPLISEDGQIAAQDYQAEKGERFDFGCPANPDSIRQIKHIFETYYSDGAYDGIFLDKIRFPSFISGLQPVLSCFCPYCRSLHNLSEPFKVNDETNPLSITSYDGLCYNTADQTLARLFAYKAEAVTSSVAELSGYFRKLGYKIGLDLFTPFLSWFVGQDCVSLAQHADFIKPMFYRETYAPAGIPLELDMYAAAFGGTRAAKESRKQYILNTLNTSSIDIEFINREVSHVRDRIGEIRLYAGIEINYNERIAKITAQYIKENITRLKGADGFALSWDLCSTPDKNLDAVIECL